MVFSNTREEIIMDNCLLIGNGLNRCLEGGIPWGNLLKDIAEERAVNYCPDISMPLEFERIVNNCLKKEKRPTDELYLEIKKAVSRKIVSAKIVEGAPHKQLINLPIQTIITTNYDMLLEQVFDKSYVAEIISNGAKYLTKETATIQKVKFYHPHGISTHPNTICLGYEHYIGITQNLRYEINTVKKTDRKKSIYSILAGNAVPNNTWGEQFYRSNIGIVGLGLYECEVDLWWLLTHRASLYYSNYEGIRDLLKNRIVYYSVVDDIEKYDEFAEKQRLFGIKVQNDKHQLLEGEHVIVKKYPLSENDNSYESAYLHIFEDIKENGIC